MMKQLIRLSLVVILVSLACSMPVYTSSAPTPKVVSQLKVKAAPNSTATPTPFQPVGSTATPIATATALPGTPDPSIAGSPGVPTPILVNQKMPEGTINMLVLGNDWRPNSGFRTDVILLVTINTGKGTVSVISFPRDLYVTIPGWGQNRINTAFPHGGFSLMADTFEYNFGVRPTYYVMTNFQGFVGIINKLGGVNVHVGQYLSDKCDLPQAVNTYCTVYPGTIAMDGQTALWYVRSRHTTNDFDRGRRAQEVLYAIFTRLMNLNVLSRLPELFSTYQNNVETNLNLEIISPIMPVAGQAIHDSSLIQSYRIGPEQVTNFVTSGGAMVLLPNYQAIAAIIHEAIFR